MKSYSVHILLYRIMYYGIINFKQNNMKIPISMLILLALIYVSFGPVHDEVTVQNVNSNAVIQIVF